MLHAEVRDTGGGIWRFATQDAEFSPANPGELAGRAVEDAEIDPGTGELRVRLSDATMLAVVPARREASDDPLNWELITPSALVLEFGAGMRWQISGADGRVPPAA